MISWLHNLHLNAMTVQGSAHRRGGGKNGTDNVKDIVKVIKRLFAMLKCSPKWTEIVKDICVGDIALVIDTLHW